MPAHHCSRLARTACPSTRCRSCSCSRVVRWTGLDAAGDTWEPLDNLTNCDDAIAAFEQVTGCSLPRPPPPSPPLPGNAVAPPPIPPTGFMVEAAPPGDLGPALMGRTEL